MLWHYFITLDKSQGTTPPTYADFQNLLKLVCARYTFFPITPYPIHSVEFKEKGSIRRNTKVYNFPHYHCIVGGWTKVFRPVFKKQGWMIFIKELHSPTDLLNTAGYIYKGHVPDCTLLCCNQVSKNLS